MTEAPSEAPLAAAAPPTRRLPAWYRGYFALALLNIVTLTVCLWLGFYRAQKFESAVNAHEVYARLLEHISDLRELGFAVNAPGNGVFLSHAPDVESQKLELAASNFRHRYVELKGEVVDNLEASSQYQIAARFPAIDQELNLMVLEARQVFAFMAVANTAEATVHMVAMDDHNIKLGHELLAMEQVLRFMQDRVLGQQRRNVVVVRTYGIALAFLVVVMAVGAGLHGRRVHRAMKLENLVRERHTRTLSAARTQAEEAARVKTQFLANMSHEIRTPMNGVLGMLDALGSTELSPVQTSLVKTASSSADLLLSIIDDILDFSKIEAGKLVIEKMPVHVPAIVQHIVSLYSVRAREKSLELRCEIDGEVPGCVLTDTTRLTQLLANFVGNAIKFTERGHVTITVSVVRHEQDAVQLRFAVADSGIGISSDAQQRLFIAFTQADNSTARRFGGTGLGLAICRQLVGLLDPTHGDIGVNSVAGEGSEFYFSMRMDVAHDDAKPIHDGSDTEFAAVRHRRFKGRVLVAEDNHVNQQVALQMLRSVGIEPELAATGREAVAAAQRDRFDLILMDYHMPELDGCGATRGIREYEQSRQLSRTPIVAVTASVLTDDKERCARAGMDDFLAKPIRKHALAIMLSKWLEQEPTDETENSQPMPVVLPTSPPKTALPALLFDAAQLLEMREISGDAFAALMERFHANVHECVQALRAAVEAQDASALHKVAHKLKGSAATLGASEIAAHCLDLEMLGKSGSTSGASPLIDALVQAYLRAKPYLDDCVAADEAA